MVLSDSSRPRIAAQRGFVAAEGLYEERKASSSDSEQNDSFQQVFLSVPLLVGARGEGCLALDAVVYVKGSTS